MLTVVRSQLPAAFSLRTIQSMNGKSPPGRATHACLSFAMPASKFSLLFLILENILPPAMRRNGTGIYLLSLMESRGTSSDSTLAAWVAPSRTLNRKGDEGTVRVTYDIDPGRGSSSNVDYFYPIQSNSYENGSVHLF